jgi:hypothetical protein
VISQPIVRSTASTPFVILLAALGATACAAGGAEFDTKVAPGFATAHHTVSVFGVYKDGQMSSEAWGALQSRLGSSLRSEACPVGYASVATAHDVSLVTAIDDYARANGPTDELLAELAPAARGDLILTVTLAGRPPTPEKVSVANESGGGSMGGGGPGGGGPGGGRGGSPQSHGDRRSHAIDTNVLDIVASFFSVSERRSVAEVSMRYTGETVDDAIAQFSRKLETTLPGATCAGWDWDTDIHADRIRNAE